MCNSVSSVTPCQGVWYLKGCGLEWLTDGVSMQTVIGFMTIIFLSVIIINMFHLRTALLPLSPPHLEAPHWYSLSVVCLVSDDRKAFDKIHCLFKKKKKKSQIFLPAVFCLLSTKMKRFAKKRQSCFRFPVITNVGLNAVSSSPYVH